MLESGRSLEEKDYLNSINRFDNIFHQNEKDKIPIYFTPGNHDINYWTTTKEIIERYKRNFGPLNKIIEKKNIKFVQINSIYLQSETPKETHDESWKFLNDYKKDKSKKVILISHVPLYRNSTELRKCGRFNEYRKQGMVNHQSHDYNTMLPKEISQKMKTKVEPDLIFSGDDHENCEYSHDGGILEYTLGSFGFCSGSLYQNIGVLSIDINNDLKYNVCITPSQLMIFSWYFVVAVVTLIIYFPLLGFFEYFRNRERKRNIYLSLKNVSFSIFVPFFILILLSMSTFLLCIFYWIS
jgi:ethanolamine phosphate phosphodiesterase